MEERGSETNAVVRNEPVILIVVMYTGENLLLFSTLIHLASVSNVFSDGRAETRLYGRYENPMMDIGVTQKTSDSPINFSNGKV